MAFFKSQGAAHLLNRIDNFNAGRALLDTGTASGTSQERFFGNDIRDQDFFGLGVAFHHSFLQRKNDLSRIQRTAGTVDRADSRASAAFNTGIKVQTVVPVELTEPGDTEAFLFFDVVDFFHEAARLSPLPVDARRALIHMGEVRHRNGGDEH